MGEEEVGEKEGAKVSIALQGKASAVGRAVPSVMTLPRDKEVAYPFSVEPLRAWLSRERRWSHRFAGGFEREAGDLKSLESVKGASAVGIGF